MPRRLQQVSGTDSQVRALIEPAIEALGFELVRVRFMSGERSTLQIMAERPDGTLSVENCVEVSRTVSALLDVEDPIRGEYNLEVSSPGIDRPLTRQKDFERWAGFDAKVELQMPIDGQRRFRGILKGVADDNVMLETDQGPVALAFNEIEQAKLVLTDALIDAHQAAEAGQQ
ncbi:MAG: ribosome maturation factor RimP [Proteobacteria bacterium]|nr:ribosome maturation factor RimP [Pseudomonadota bacterium]